MLYEQKYNEITNKIIFLNKHVKFDAILIDNGFQIKLEKN